MIWFQKTTLAVAGVTALGIGATITVAPQSFYALYGITLGADPSLLSEVRAPGANLAVLGGLMLLGLLRPALTRLSLTLAAAVFLAYAAGRAVGFVLDGIPSAGLLEAFAIELVIGMIAVLAVRLDRPAPVHA